ncbi:MAG: tetratricopeptide repeat protein [Ignavibacteria bacterium]|nr:tetratricopeptide repeat protein [Ignavibacteria bacterium]
MTPEQLQTTVEALEVLVTSGTDVDKADAQAREFLVLPQMLASHELHCRVLLALVLSLRKRELAKEALPFAEKAVTCAKEAQSKELIAKALGNCGIVYQLLSDNDNALAYLQQALAISEELGITSGMASNSGNIGIVFGQLSDYPKALEYLYKALAWYEEYDGREGIAATLSNIGLVYWNLSDYPTALEYLQKSLAMHEILGNTSGITTNLGNIGVVFQDLSDYPKALEYFQKTLSICERHDNKTGIANNLCNIGNVYIHLSDYASALVYFEKALAINEELGSASGIATNYCNVGIVYQNLSDYPKALEFYQKALTLFKGLGNKDGITSDLCNIGNVYYHLSDYPKALEYFQQSLDIYKELGRKHCIAINLGNIGATYTKQNFVNYNTLKAEELLMQALGMNEETGAYRQNIEVAKSLGELYEQMGRWKEANEYNKKYHELRVIVQSEEATKQAQLMEHRRKIEESERDRQLKIVRHEVTVNLLHKTLPPSIAERLMNGEKNIADKFESVTILFADIVGFTPLSVRLEPKMVVELLNNLFTRFDKLTAEHGVERIKTIGDAYMIVAGAPERCDDHAERMAKVALAMIDQTTLFCKEVGENIQIRIGINSGEAIGAVVGETKFSYDLWSDAVNTASRMESHGEAGKIHVSEEFKHAVETQIFASLQFIERGEIDIKGKGLMKTYFLEKEQV